MIKIGITGSIASGKTTASKILSFNRGPLFSADEAIKKLYEKNHFKKLIIKKFKIKNGKNIKKHLRNKILLNQNYIKTFMKNKFKNKNVFYLSNIINRLPSCVPNYYFF